ncbi:MAG: hypothetical protein QM733_15275 [Ilumatobacteraceae bacterium]
MRRALIDHLPAGAITEVLFDLAACARPLSAVADPDRVNALITDIRGAHPATYRVYGLARFERPPVVEPLGQTDIARTATTVVEYIADLLDRSSERAGGRYVRRAWPGCPSTD